MVHSSSIFCSSSASSLALTQLHSLKWSICCQTQALTLRRNHNCWMEPCSLLHREILQFCICGTNSQHLHNFFSFSFNTFAHSDSNIRWRCKHTPKGTSLPHRFEITARVFHQRSLRRAAHPLRCRWIVLAAVRHRSCISAYNLASMLVHTHPFSLTKNLHQYPVMSE